MHFLTSYIIEFLINVESVAPKMYYVKADS